MTKCVMFDFDGVLVDTEGLWLQCIIDGACDYGLELNVKKLLPFLGFDDRVLKNKLKALLHSSTATEELFEHMKQLFNLRSCDLNARPGVEQYLASARQLGLLTALVSNSSQLYIDSWLKRLSFSKYFDLIVSPVDGLRNKPNPDMYLCALSRLGLTPEESVCFEDSLYGLLAAEAAGVPCILTPTSTSAVLLEPFVNSRVDMSKVEFSSALKKIDN